MYYLFEFRIGEGKYENTYGPYRCCSKVDSTKVYNEELIKKLVKTGIVAKYQHPYDGWRTFYINSSHKYIYFSTNYDKILDLIKKFERDITIDNLMSENI